RRAWLRRAKYAGIAPLTATEATTLGARFRRRAGRGRRLCSAAALPRAAPLVKIPNCPCAARSAPVRVGAHGFATSNRRRTAGRGGGTVDAVDSKSTGATRAGSIPALGTKFSPTT